MRRIASAGLCLVAVFVLGVTASASAGSFAPELGECVSQVGGR